MKRKCSILSLLIALIALTAGCSAVSSTNNSNGGGSGETAVEGNAVFVSALGSTNNSGLTKSSPIPSLQAAIDLARASNFTAIYISGNLPATNTNGYGYGIFIPILTNVDISGGWSSDFSSRSGESLIDGKQIAKTVLAMIDCRGIILRGLAVIGGSGNDIGGGIYMTNCSSNTVNCTVSNNVANVGGGIYLKHCDYNTIGGTIASNYASVIGGGAYIEYCSSNNITANFYTNTGIGASGGVGSTVVSYSVFSGRYVGNYSSYGGAIYMQYWKNCTINGEITGNSAQFGGGIYDEYSVSNTISAVISGNAVDNEGGGVFISSSAWEYYTGTISGNVATNFDCGGIAAYNCSNSVFSGNVINNASRFIGGMGFSTGISNTISGTVSGNSSWTGCGGIYLCDDTCYTTISGNVLNNSASNECGGVYLTSANSNTFTSTCVVRYNRCNTVNSTYQGGGIVLSSGIDNTIVPGALITNNYNGSTGTVEDNIYP